MEEIERERKREREDFFGLFTKIVHRLVQLLQAPHLAQPPGCPCTRGHTGLPSFTSITAAWGPLLQPRSTRANAD